MKFQIFTTLIFAVLLSSCQCNYTRTNNSSDKNVALDVTSQFYSDFVLHKYSKTHKLFSENFFKATDSIKFDSSLSGILKKYGEIKDYDVVDWSTKVVSGTNSSADYELLYKVTYVKDSTKEYFRLQKIDDKVKIIDYTVNHNELK